MERGPTHNVRFALAVGVALVILAGQGNDEAEGLTVLGEVLSGLLLGTGTVVSHIGADALTPAGVRPFWLLRDDEYRYSVARASNPLASYALLSICAGVAVLVLTIGRILT